MKFIVIIIASILLSCINNNSDKTRIEILPLKLKSISPSDYSITDKKKSFVLNAYFVRGDYKSREELEVKVDSFLSKEVNVYKQNLKEYGYVIIDFYKESDVLNEEYKESDSNFLDWQINDLLFSYRLNNQGVLECYYYNDGKIVKQVRKGKLF
jgi:hypothetical protein